MTFIALPKPDFDRLVSEEEAFRQFVFAAYSRRLIDLLRVVDDVAFGRMDMRLAERLLSLVGGRNDIQNNAPNACQRTRNSPRSNLQCTK